ncbi:MAG: hypothetical protein CMJ49_02475 [Planctomycetaceae bacterium]|nr:hypothetical protein [Planctomycetaceae bacterium]
MITTLRRRHASTPRRCSPLHVCSGVFVALLGLTLTPTALAGPYSKGADDPNNPFDAPLPGFTGPAGDGVVTAGNVVNPLFLDWATTVADYSPAPGVGAIWSDPATALGEVTGNNFHIVSLGDLDQPAIDNGDPTGTITLQFNTTIANGPGPDFATFENAFINGTATDPNTGLSFGLLFAELGYVEVSTDGSTFARFDSTSSTPTPAGGQAFLTVNPTDVHNLVGKHINAGGQSWGTPFDLSQLAGHAAVLSGQVDLFDIQYVRIIDIPGSGDYLDSHGAPIYDPWVTVDSSGVDLEAIGVIHHTFPGDINFDRTTDIGDMALIGANWNTGTTWDTADVTGDGSVDVADLAVVGANWGATYGNTARIESSPGAAVPAPTALAAALPALTLLGRRKHPS